MVLGIDPYSFHRDRSGIALTVVVLFMDEVKIEGIRTLVSFYLSFHNPGYPY